MGPYSAMARSQRPPNGANVLQDCEVTDDHRIARGEQAVDRLRQRFGDNAVVRGLAFDPNDPD